MELLTASARRPGRIRGAGCGPQLEDQAEVGGVQDKGPNPGGADRMFAGKEAGEALVRLSDKQGRPRLVMKVDKTGSPSIEMLDDAGKVTRRITGE